MGFSREEYWSGLPRPPPGDLPNPGIEAASPATHALQVDPLLLSHLGSPQMHLQFNSVQSLSLVRLFEIP